MIVRHPAFPEVVRDVSDPTEWVSAGWVLVTPPVPPRPKPKPRRQKFPRI